MHGLEIEHRRIGKGKSLSVDLVRHFSRRRGQAIIVTDEPAMLMSFVRNQWLMLEQRIDLEMKHASIADSEYVSAIRDRIAYMQSVSFLAESPVDMLTANITFATAVDFISVSSMCHTAYITYNFAPAKLHMLTSWMPPNGLIVIYGD